MGYSIGEKIVYPMHGAGIISGIEEQEFLGEVKSYYLLKLSYGSMGIMVPVDNADELGIRDVIDPSAIADVMEYLKKPCCECNTNWNKRHRENLDKLRSGDIFEAAEVYKSLYIRELDKTLSTGEKKLLNNAKQILYSELMLSAGYEVEQVDTMVRQAVEEGVKNNK